MFEAYARVLHSAHRRTGPAAGEVEPVTWGEVAEANGRTAHSLMEWYFITAALRRGRAQRGLWDEGRRAEIWEGNTINPRPERS